MQEVIDSLEEEEDVQTVDVEESLLAEESPARFDETLIPEYRITWAEKSSELRRRYEAEKAKTPRGDPENFGSLALTIAGAGLFAISGLDNPVGYVGLGLVNFGGYGLLKDFFHDVARGSPNQYGVEKGREKLVDKHHGEKHYSVGEAPKPTDLFVSADTSVWRLGNSGTFKKSDKESARQVFEDFVVPQMDELADREVLYIFGEEEQELVGTTDSVNNPKTATFSPETSIHVYADGDLQAEFYTDGRTWSSGNNNLGEDYRDIKKYFEDGQFPLIEEW